MGPKIFFLICVSGLSFGIFLTMSSRMTKVHADTSEIIGSILLSEAFHGKSSAWLVPLQTRDLLHSDDGGLHWTVTSGRAVGGFGQISFINESQGWATGLNGIWKTSDAGKRWEKIAQLQLTSESTGRKGGFQFVDESHGWVLSSPSRLWQTTDGGANWKECRLPGEAYKAKLLRFYFINPLQGWIACNQGILLNTNDSGNTWKIVSLGRNASGNAIKFIDSMNGWALSGNSIYCTTDGGLYWNQCLRAEEPFESPVVLSLDLLDNRNGWVVGHSNMWAGRAASASPIKGIVLRTNDGGNSWKHLEVKLPEVVFSTIHFADLSRGWLIARENVYRTSDGGKSWHKVLNIPYGN